MHSAKTVPLEVVSHVDLKRYLGRWYEIATIPQRFQKGCVAYWILARDAAYQWAVVGHPSRNYLWILSRSPQMDASLYDRLLSLVSAKGYDLSALKRTPQPLEESPKAKKEA